MTATYHDEYLLDRAAMLVMQGMIAFQPQRQFGPEARPGFDTLMETAPAAEGVAVLYVHGGAYVIG